MSDYLFMLDNHLDAGQTRVVTGIRQIAEDAGLNVWLTGGAMRDMLRGAPIRDLDFTVEHNAIKMGKALAAALGGEVVSEDPLKRWVELLLPEGITASVSNARTEKYSKPGGKPQIAPATIHADLSRRDFSINAIGLSLSRGSRGLLVDPANGEADLHSHELRTTNSYAFFDDPSRIFRMFRFQFVQGFAPVPRTQSQLENALLENYEAVAPVSALVLEIRLAAGSASASGLVQGLDSHGLLKVISASLTGAKLNSAGIAKLEGIAHEVLPAGYDGGWLAFLSVFVEKLNVRERAEVLRAFELTPAENAVFKKLDAQAASLEKALRTAGVQRPSAVWETLNAATTDDILLVLYRSTARVAQDRIRAYFEKYRPMSLDITDEQVVEAGGKLGTAKFEKLKRSMIVTLLNARPKKVEVVEPEVVVPLPFASGPGRPRKQ
jgi:tRNA nucleotidyltransferase (CCA-adding enzyme)